MKEQAQGRSSTEMTLRAVSLNIGGRNTNPLEFLLDGDSSKEGLSATRARVRAQEAMVDAECGPARMASTERADEARRVRRDAPEGDAAVFRT